MDAWWPKLLEAEFKPALGNEAFDALHGMLEFGAPEPGSEPAAPDFADGWYGYVSKDLRDVLAAGKGARRSQRRPTRALLRRRLARRCRRRCRLAAGSALRDARRKSTATARAPKTPRPAALT